nr:hypothetical protein [Tanacetum cinerariifolium]
AHGLARQQRRQAANGPGCAHAAPVPALGPPARSHFRELGKRIPANGRVRGAHRARGPAASIYVGLPAHGALLVRVVPELAERVRVYFLTREPVDFSSSAILTAVQARRCSYFPNRQVAYAQLPAYFLLR